MGLRMGSSEPTRGRPPPAPPGVVERAGAPAAAAAAAPEVSGATLDVGTAACVGGAAGAAEPLPSGAGEPDAFSKGVAMAWCALSLSLEKEKGTRESFFFFSLNLVFLAAEKKK